MERTSPSFAAFLNYCIRHQVDVRLVPQKHGNTIRIVAEPTGYYTEDAVYEVRGNTLIPLNAEPH
jgi:hypothetical protein